VVDFWGLVDELYSDQAYLCAFADWLSDTEGDEAPVTVAMRDFANGLVVIYHDDRTDVNWTVRYDLISKKPIDHGACEPVWDFFTFTTNSETRVEFRDKYLDFLRKYDGWFICSFSSPLKCLNAYIDYPPTKPLIILPPENVTSY
jgi:hypothetical protein